LRLKSGGLGLRLQISVGLGFAVEKWWFGLEVADLGGFGFCGCKSGGLGLRLPISVGLGVWVDGTSG
jgi:hypothetical protein